MDIRIHQKKHKLFVGEEDLAHLAHAISASSTFIKSLGVASKLNVIDMLATSSSLHIFQWT